MLNRAYRLSLTSTAFFEEYDKLRTTFLNLDYPVNLINSSINKFLRNIDNNTALDDASDGTLISWYHYHLKINNQLTQ